MLCNLHIKNFALIEEAEIDFGTGLNILTGETGAGKSILIDAIGAALGGRLRGDLIRRGCDFAYVELLFSVPEEDKKRELAAMDISTEYDCIVVSRKILPGRSIHKINDETVTSAKVRQVTSLLLDIHGQHEHQSLMKTEKHLEVLDQYGGTELEEQRNRAEKAYTGWRKAVRELEEFQMNPEERTRRLDFLRYELQEIEEAAIREGEEEELEKNYRRMANSRKIAEALQEVEGRTEGEGISAAAEAVSRASRALSEALRLDEGLEGLGQELTDIEDLISGFSRELSDYAEGLTFDEAELRETEARLDLIRRLMAKYGANFEEIEKAKEERSSEIASLEEYEQNREEAERRLAAAKERLEMECGKLSEMRREALPGLEAELSAAIRELNFPYVDFRISLRELPEPTRTGREEAEFLISLNSGVPARPLAQVASGGELSRIMLAIKAVLADKDQIPTLIFDEIDTGISGRTAQKVSEKLALIGRSRQVLCITHLPQIASMADCHFGIVKASGESQTITSVKRLSDRESVEELARLLGGAEITEAVYQNACEMKALAAKTKKAEVK